MTTAEGVGLAVAGSLAATADAASTIEAIAATIGDGELLLIIDNCEQIIEPVARLVADLLERCRNLTVLATSRERLRAGGEVTIPIDPLPTPAPDAVSAGGAGITTVRLFADRGRHRSTRTSRSTTPWRATLPRFAASSTGSRWRSNWLLRSCACSRRPNSSPGSVDGSALLDGGARTGPTRQQTLDAVIGWSYDLLDDEEAAVFRRLGAFDGPFTVDGAEEAVGPTVTHAGSCPSSRPWSTSHCCRLMPKSSSACW